MRLEPHEETGGKVLPKGGASAASQSLGSLKIAQSTPEPRSVFLLMQHDDVISRNFWRF